MFEICSKDEVRCETKEEHSSSLQKKILAFTWSTGKTYLIQGDQKILYILSSQFNEITL